MHSQRRIFSGVRDALILILWGTGIFWLAGSGRLSIYLHPSLQSFTIAAGISLFILAGFTLVNLATMRCVPVSACECGDEHGQPDHHARDRHHDDHGDHHPAKAFPALLVRTTILLVPVVVLLSGNADRFTATTVSNRGVLQDLAKLPSANASAAKTAAKTSTGTVENVSESPFSSSGTPGGPPMPLQVIDMLYALQMPSYREEFEGKEVELIGQYVPLTTGNPKGDRFQAVRLFITCCAADAKPVGVTVRASSIPKVSEMSWLKITGKPTFPMEGGRRAAVLEAAKIEPCDAPSEPFVY